MSEESVYISEVKVERIRGSLRNAHLPAREEPIQFGIHSGIAEHYGADQESIEPTTATLDYLVASAVG